MAVIAVRRYEDFQWPVMEAHRFGSPAVCADLPVLRQLAGGAAFPRVDEMNLIVATWKGLAKSLADPEPRRLTPITVRRFRRDRCVSTLRAVLLGTD